MIYSFIQIRRMVEDEVEARNTANMDVWNTQDRETTKVIQQRALERVESRYSGLVETKNQAKVNKIKL